MRRFGNGREVQAEIHALNAELDVSQLRCADQVNLNRAMRSIGSLGGGNHFIKVDRTEDGRLFLVVHSGSRHLYFHGATPPITINLDRKVGQPVRLSFHLMPVPQSGGFGRTPAGAYTKFSSNVVPEALRGVNQACGISASPHFKTCQSLSGGFLTTLLLRPEHTHDTAEIRKIISRQRWTLRF